VPIRFTDADFELADMDGDGELDAIVFRENGRKPTPGSTLTVATTRYSSRVQSR
jgi:hypothetical protein